MFLFLVCVFLFFCFGLFCFLLLFWWQPSPCMWPQPMPRKATSTWIETLKRAKALLRKMPHRRVKTLMKDTMVLAAMAQPRTWAFMPGSSRQADEAQVGFVACVMYAPNWMALCAIFPKIMKETPKTQVIWSLGRSYMYSR